MPSARRRLGLLGVGTACAVVLLGACSSSGRSGDNASLPARGAAGSTTLKVVASTNVYGDIAKQIAGDTVRVTSIISDPDTDPHSYEASTQNQLALSKADVVIENGGGYDDFIDTMLTSAGTKATVLNVVNLSGRTAPAGGELNEHVWYDFPSVEKLTDQLVVALSARDSAGAATFTANATAFKQKLHQLEGTEATIKSAHSGAGVAITEPVPLYLLAACGLENRTPQEFSRAIEEGTDLSPTVLEDTLDLFKDKRVTLLAYNEQTSGAPTERVLSAAKANHIAVVGVTETLPSGTDYVSWMSGNLAAIRSALG